MKLVWGADYPGDVRTVDVHIRRLREKIEANPSEPKYVHTKWGIGYYYKKLVGLEERHGYTSVKDLGQNQEK